LESLPLVDQLDELVKSVKDLLTERHIKSTISFPCFLPLKNVEIPLLKFKEYLLERVRQTTGFFYIHLIAGKGMGKTRFGLEAIDGIKQCMIHHKNFPIVELFQYLVKNRSLTQYQPN
jgi:hypothetical protein